MPLTKSTKFIPGVEGKAHRKLRKLRKLRNSQDHRPNQQTFRATGIFRRIR